MTDAKEPKPGFKTTEFWMTAIAVILGVVFTAGLPEDSVVLKVAGMAASVLAIMGYQVSRGGAKKAAKILAICVSLGLVAGCCGRGSIPVDDIEAPVRVLVDRHDKLLSGEIDPKGDLTGDGKVDGRDEAKKKSWSRTGELLILQLEAAKAKED